MSPRAVGWCVAGVCAAVSLSRMVVLKNPQPGTAKWWLVAAAFVFVLSFVLPGQAQGQLNRR